jgi:hypothetical protein
MKKISFLLLVPLLLGACTSPQTPLPPTATLVDVEAIQTAAVETVVAGVTQTADAFTDTPAPTETTAITLTPTIMATVPLLASETPTLATCHNSAFVGDVTHPDNSQVEAGKSFQKTWKFKNIGSCTWTRTYTIRYAYGERMNGRDSYLDAEVLPGAEAEISLTLTAPTKPGTYKGYWTLFNNNGYQFGEYVSVIIVVP